MLYSSPTILDLVRNGTLSAEMAATIWAAMDERWSFLVAAIPRLAGKSTMLNACLSLLPAEVPVHHLSGDEQEIGRLKAQATGGYLVAQEFSQAPVPGYIWGSPVRRLFGALESGYSLAATLHASTVDEVFDAICNGNSVPDQQASAVKLVLYIRRFGDSPDTLWRRLAEVHEIERVEGGQPVARLLFAWREDGDRFEAMEPSRLLRSSAQELSRRAGRIRKLVEAERTSESDVEQMVREKAPPP